MPKGPADLLAGNGWWRYLRVGDYSLARWAIQEMGDELAAVNRAMKERGMPESFLVFHVGW